MNDRTNTRMITMRASGKDARQILSRIDHDTCAKGIDGHWFMYRGDFYGDTNGPDQPSAQSICWLYCWAKTGQGSRKAARQSQKAFDDIFDRDYDWLSGRLSLEQAIRLRYMEKDIESEFNDIIRSPDNIHNAQEIIIWNPETGITDLESDEKELLSTTEIPGIKAAWLGQQERLKGTNIVSDFIERLGREWAIETGIIENLYDIDRGVTQTLIDRGFRAELLTHGSIDRPREFVLGLLRDQKRALDGVFDFVKSARPLSTSCIKELHAVLLRSQELTEAVDPLGRQIEVPLIKGDWKIQPNHPVRDGVTYKYCPPEHVAAEMDRLVDLHLAHVAEEVSAEVQAAWLHHRFTQIHPFQDGNGRLARALASHVLIGQDLFPLVVTRDDRTDYIDALEAADAGDLKPLVDLIAKLQRVQFAKAVAISETVLSDKTDVRATLDGLYKAADRTAVERRQELEKVFDIAGAIRERLCERLNEIAPDVGNALQRITPTGAAWIKDGDEETGIGHWYRAQIIHNAKNHLRYYVNFGEFRSWVALNMVWKRKARLVFAIHGIGHGFTGSLICAPFLEIQDEDEDGDRRSTLVPVAEEGFVFFYKDTEEAALKRLQPWLESVLKVALNEVTENL